ncbi:hypothetical protein, partial [Kineococcus glutinatus]|uniref:hypothetical protein n=1 Tax=Kineococcus glutinatus TaxID=1070872 RepID=UPI0031EDD0D7
GPRCRAVLRRQPLAAVPVGAVSLVGAGIAGAVLLGGEQVPSRLPIAELTWWDSPAPATSGEPAPGGADGR